MLFEIVLEHNEDLKYLYTEADTEEDAGEKFHRYICSQWIGAPWDSPETLLAGTFDKIENGVMI